MVVVVAVVMLTVAVVAATVVSSPVYKSKSKAFYCFVLTSLPGAQLSLENSKSLMIALALTGLLPA